MKKKIIIPLAAIAAIGIGLYFYMYKGHRDIASESADYAVTVKELQQQFSAEAVKANRKFADKTISISGKITAVDLQNHTVVIDEKLSAVFKDSLLKGISKAQKVNVKGRFVGYDDLLEEFKMDEASLSE